MFSILVLVMFGCGIPQTRKYQQKHRLPEHLIL